MSVFIQFASNIELNVILPDEYIYWLVIDLLWVSIAFCFINYAPVKLLLFIDITTNYTLWIYLATPLGENIYPLGM